jgi:hypothetical protein
VSIKQPSKLDTCAVYSPLLPSKILSHLRQSRGQLIKHHVKIGSLPSVIPSIIASLPFSIDAADCTMMMIGAAAKA